MFDFAFVCISLFLLVFQSSRRGRESVLLCFYCLTDVLLLEMFCAEGWFAICVGVFPDRTQFFESLSRTIEL